MSEPETKTVAPVRGYINNDFGIKMPISGKKAPEGAFNDFRIDLSYPISAGNWGSLALDSGFWVATAMKEPDMSVLKWWTSITYKNPNWLNFYFTPRFYFGTTPETDTSLASIAFFAGFKPTIYEFDGGPKLGIELSFYAKPYEGYFSGPVDHLQTYYASMGFFADFGNLQLKAAAQIWDTKTDKIDGSSAETTHGRLYFGPTFYF